ncbi:uncharacterized protein LOC117283028 isoform X2 [Cryptotermes secundus]|uniref:uncharacterized protein LOC117283028 isoform X2 n=1 Tax=Cryptotermes secundus TaxID=105785 RepID=UPI001454B92D|nr:uncharacterized protein LOC117283028 isoform X2 [Cryptotermes secundus]
MCQHWIQSIAHLQDFEKKMSEEKKRQEEEGKRGAWNEVEIEMMKSLGVTSATVVQPQTSKKRRATNQMLNSITQMMMDTYLMQRRLSGA